VVAVLSFWVVEVTGACVEVVCLVSCTAKVSFVGGGTWRTTATALAGNGSATAKEAGFAWPKGS